MTSPAPSTIENPPCHHQQRTKQKRTHFVPVRFCSCFYLNKHTNSASTEPQRKSALRATLVSISPARQPQGRYGPSPFCNTTSSPPFTSLSVASNASNIALTACVQLGVETPATVREREGGRGKGKGTSGYRHPQADRRANLGPSPATK